tara:strand:- start:12899 stop:13945 length:1047 start_codon:yes stop_codon:yes gene_type:complete
MSNRGSGVGGGANESVNQLYPMDIPKTTTPEKHQRRVANVIVKGIKRCKKDKKVVVLGYGLDGHFNMLIFNYYRKEVERYEPHGGETGYNRASTRKADETLKVFLDKYLNPLLFKEGLGMWKYQTLPQSCPLPPKGELKWRGIQSVFGKYREPTQSGDLQIPITAKNIKKQTGINIKVPIGEPNGWCVAWSLIYLNQRLKNLSSPSADVKKRMRMILNKYPNRIKDLLRYVAKQQYTSIVRINRQLKLDEFERGVMYISIERTAKGQSTKFTNDEIEKLFKSYYGDVDGAKKYKKFYDKMMKEAKRTLNKKSGFSPATLLAQNLKYLWKNAISEYTSKALGTKRGRLT